jgi:hypothetical protein
LAEEIGQQDREKNAKSLQNAASVLCDASEVDQKRSEHFRILSEFMYKVLSARFQSNKGLPDGIFSNQKSQFGFISECLVEKDFAKIYCHLVYYSAILNILWPFGIIYGYFGIFFPFWYVAPRKIWQPWVTV